MIEYSNLGQNHHWKGSGLYERLDVRSCDKVIGEGRSKIIRLNPSSC